MFRLAVSQVVPHVVGAGVSFGLAILEFSGNHNDVSKQNLYTQQFLFLLQSISFAQHEHH